MGLHLPGRFHYLRVQLAGVPLNIELTHIAATHMPEYYCVRYVYCNLLSA